MYIVESYSTAVLFCIITMLCWGSWANTQKLASQTWRFELFYWDYVWGILILATVFAFTFGSIGDSGRSFLNDLSQAETANLMSAFTGGIIFNAANILLSAAIAIAGMAVAFPIGIGLALVLGVLINYLGHQQGDPLFLFTGVALIVAAIILNAFAYKKTTTVKQTGSAKGIFLSLVAGLLMSFFYRFVADSMDLVDLHSPAAGKLTPYSAVFIFSVGIFVSNFVFNSLLIRYPFTGKPTSYREYFNGKLTTHSVGILGGVIWGVGNSFNLIAAGQAGPAISYGLGQGATLVAAIWGVFVWREFKDAPPAVSVLISLMFLCFIAGLALIIYAGQ